MRYPEIYVLRHGETEWNAEGRMQGRLNSPLTARGHAQAARQGVIMRGLDLSGFDIISSPAGRAFETAAVALGPLVTQIRTDARLVEIDVGGWSGRLRAELPQSEGPDAYIALYNAAPGGEGLAGVHARVAGFLADVERPSVLITHGITSRVLREQIVGSAAQDGPGPDGGQGCVYHLKDGVQTLLR